MFFIYIDKYNIFCILKKHCFRFLNKNMNRLWDGLLTEIKAPWVLLRLFEKPELQSLLNLAKVDDVGKYYRSWDNVIDLPLKYATKEDFLKHIIEVDFRVHIKKGFGFDIKIIWDIILCWDDVRELFKVWLLTDEAVKNLYAYLCSNGKVWNTDLILEDKNMFWFNEFQMKIFMEFWFSVNTFNQKLNLLIEEKLTQ